ncbi:MAG: hypothetical protein QM743_08515 [Chitinophagaceae bacterium]
MALNHFTRILPLSLAVALASCAGNGEHKDPATPKADILAANADTTVNPAEDFFAFAEGGWLKANKIPDEESSWGIANLVNEEALQTQTHH